MPGDAIAARSRVLHELAARKKRAFYEAQIGRTVRVLFEERLADGRYVGFSDNYVKVAVKTPRELANRFEFVHVTAVDSTRPQRPPLAVGELVSGPHAIRSNGPVDDLTALPHMNDSCKI